MPLIFYKQQNARDCGPACIRMISSHYGRHYNLDKLRGLAGFSREGVSLLGISEAAEKIGFRTRAVTISYGQLSGLRLPCILHWNQNHFVVLYAIKMKRGRSCITVADPGKGIVYYNSEDEFCAHWSVSGESIGDPRGIALLLEPSPEFYEQSGEKEYKLGWGFILRYLSPTRWQIGLVFFTLFVTSLLQLLLPFLTQSVVDTGIGIQDMDYVGVVLIAQMTLVFSRTVVDFIRTRLLLRISNVLNLSILSDFWIKLNRLPLSYFESHQTGDSMQRINDHKQIQSFLTGTAITTFFSVFSFLIFSIVLVIYSYQLFVSFFIGSLVYFAWIQVFLRFRRKLNYEAFYLSARENNATLQMVQGAQEIRLNNAEKLKRWNWEDIQAMIFRLNFKNLTYGQWQQAGALLINQSKDIFITFLVAGMVIEGKLTLGAMLAIQYIIGQLNSPVEQWVGFVQNAQDAKISLERLSEIHKLEDEEPEGKFYLSRLPENKTIQVNHLSFTYPGAGNEPVLIDICLRIPEGRVTAIVGVSGSGKTTLVKLLLKIYDSYQGEIRIGDGNFNYLSPSFWRSQCGSVLQDGYIFNDTIQRNVVVGDEYVDQDRLIRACRIANILSFIESLPNGFQTNIGVEGVGVSQGQRQRLLIARAVYRDPQYLFFDEATNALDANNESAIVENLNSFFEGRTVVVIAHRLSTVKNADKIVVLHNGQIIEEGDHETLCAFRGKYYELVRNQIELQS